MTAAAALRRTRERLGWTQELMGQVLGEPGKPPVPANTIARWERGDPPIRHGGILLLALCEVRRRARTRPRDEPE